MSYYSPLNNPLHPMHDIAVEQFDKAYPFQVSLNDLIPEGRGVEDDDIDIAAEWLLKNKIDMAWGFRRTVVYFSRKEDAVLFKMGIWLV